MISKKGKDFDIILVTGEYYEDHPLSPSGVIARVLDARGYNIGIIEKPLSKEDFTRLGRPRLCFAITAGSVDSMVNNYTPLKKKREIDKFSKTTQMPDRAIIFYCNKLKEHFKDAVLVIGGIEASLRRFAHYDYWDNSIRRSVLVDSRADILVYGNGEKQIIEIADRLKNRKELAGVAGTCVISGKKPDGFTEIPSFKEVVDDKKKFCKSHIMFTNNADLCQKYDNRFVLQYKYPEYKPSDLDWIYSLPFSRELRKDSLLTLARFSVVTHRGCFGKCNFCSLTLHQGDKIISRSEKSILDEIKRLTKHPDFKGYIDDLGGPSANMYGMDCDANCGEECIKCKKLSHKRLIDLLRKAREIKGVKKIFIRSGIRYDLAVRDKKFIEEISKHHISGCLKIAPEHFSAQVLKLMNKDNAKFEEFKSAFEAANKRTKQSLRHYIMICHPGETAETLDFLLSKVRKMQNIEQFQMFMPTPMTISSCMYWTGMNPFTMKKIDVVYDYRTKKEMKRAFLKAIIPARGQR